MFAPLVDGEESRRQLNPYLLTGHPDPSLLRALRQLLGANLGSETPRNSGFLEGSREEKAGYGERVGSAGGWWDTRVAPGTLWRAGGSKHAHDLEKAMGGDCLNSSSVSELRGPFLSCFPPLGAKSTDNNSSPFIKGSFEHVV